MVYQSPYSRLDLPETNILSYIYPQGEQPSDKPIWIDASDPRNSLSPRQALPWIKRVAALLDQMQIGKNEAVMILSPNHIFVPLAYLGIVGAGRVFSGANPAYTVSEIEYQIRNTGTKLILVHPSLVDTAIKAGLRAGLKDDRILLFSDRSLVSINGIKDWRDLTVESDSYSWDDMGAASKNVLATVNYSSGTTGLPKGVSISHYNIIANSEQTIFMRDQEYKSSCRGEERWLGFLPLYHAYGQLYICIMAPKLHVPVYIMQKFVYEVFLQSIQKYQITHLQLAPPVLIMLDKRPETSKYNLSSLKSILCGAAPLSKELQNSISGRFKVTVLQGWGMTEVTCGAIHVPGGTLDDSGSVGLLDPNTECKLLDDDGKEVESGHPGEMYIRGPQVCVGYWRNFEATKETIDSQGWLRTGDIAIVKDNWFWIIDRKKELIKVNALQVAPAELEAVLLENEYIADAAVVGITLRGQEWPRAYIVLKDENKISADDIQNWMKPRVAKHKQLAGGIKFINEIPKLASGKIQRKVMRNLAKEDAKEMECETKARL